MKNSLKRIIAVILTFAIASTLVCFAFAGNDNSSTTISVLSANVAGLPIPSFASSNKRVVPETTKALGSMLNESGADIICVQEDFQYHPILARQMTNYTYQTYTSGGIPAGDGLNLFSKYPIYNVKRVAWKEYCGILHNGNDGLTPKGFIAVTADINGVLVDVYGVHVDAYGSEADNRAKKAQFIQLRTYIEENSADRPIIIVGDYNVTFHLNQSAELYETLIEGAGFRDGWVEVQNDGNYLRDDTAQASIDSWYAKYNGLYWGLWDSVERLLYRSGNGVVITPTDFVYENYTNNETDREALTDHNVMFATVTVDASDYERPDIELNPIRKTFIKRFFHSFAMVFRCIYLLLRDTFSELITGKLF